MRIPAALTLLMALGFAVWGAGTAFSGQGMWFGGQYRWGGVVVCWCGALVLTATVVLMGVERGDK